MQLRTKLLAGVSLVGLAVAALVAVNAADPFVPAQQPVGYIGQPVPSNIDVTSGKEKMFSIDYNAFDWSGNLHAYGISSAGAITATDAWTGGATAKIGAQAANDRIIVTANDVSGGAAGIPFRWANLAKGDTGHRKLLDAAAMDASDSDILNFVRGDTSKDLKHNGSLRARGSVLGDIIHSTPVYHTDGTNKTVFVGANDGMMHAINAADGTERFAYIPGAVMGKLDKLASKDYQHQYYVDGGISVRTMNKQTFLVGALGGGGKALYALDVTSMPSDESGAASKVLWEVTDKSAGYENLGYTYSSPLLMKLNATTPVVVVGNGYYGDNPSANGHAVLYVINAKTGAKISEIDTGAGSKTAPNGLSSPSVRDTDNDGFDDTAFAGDLHGNMWKFGLNDGKATLLHAATSPSLAITMAPGLAPHPSGGTMVLFVTGRMLTPGDVSDKAVHYAYGVWDGAKLDTGTYIEQNLTELEYGTEKLRVRSVSNKPLDYSDGNKGWKVALPAGERVVGDGAYVNGNVFQFFSTNPTKSPDAKPPGENWWMQLNYLTGGDTRSVVFDLNADRKFTGDDLIDVKNGSTTTTMYPVGRHMGGGVRSQLVGVAAGGIDVFQASFDRNGAPKAPVVVEVTPEVIKGERGVEGGHFDTDLFCYDRCGGLQSRSDGAFQYKGYNGTSGIYAFGRASDYAVVGRAINYVHVHEYDDIFDVTGLSMINPSQDYQRLHTVFAPTYASKSVPDTPALKAGAKVPPEATVVGTPTDTVTNVAKNTEKDTISYLADSPIVYVSGPVPTLVTTQTGTQVAMVTTRKYTSTAVLLTYSYSASGVKNYPYKQTKTRTEKTWTTTITESEISENKKFKLLMANQQHSPAISFKVVGALTPGNQPEYDGPVTGYQTEGTLDVSKLTTYSMASVKEMMWSMPLSAFVVQEWVAGDRRTGVHPMHPNCAGVQAKEPVRGVNDEWRNGALTLQIVSSDVTQSDIEMNVKGNSKLGYRLKPTSYEKGGKLVAEYLIYWHHPEVVCMKGSAYRKDPAVTTKLAGAPAVPGKPANGSKDPHGVFAPSTGTTPVIPPNPPDTVTTNPDGSVTTIVWTHVPSGPDGGYIKTGTSTTVWPNGGYGSDPTKNGGVLVGGENSDPPCTVNCDDVKPTVDASGENSKSPNLGRINWRELQR